MEFDSLHMATGFQLVSDEVSGCDIREGDTEHGVQDLRRIPNRWLFGGEFEDAKPLVSGSTDHLASQIV